jgi:hypothetical protein
MLTTCTLVCKSWLPLAQCLLYYSVTVKSGSYYLRRKPGTFRPEVLLQQPHNLEFTRSFSIYVRGRSESTTTLPLTTKDDSLKGSQNHVHIPEFLSLLAHTPRVRHLKLSVDWAGRNICPFEPHIQDWLSTLVLPSIEALEIDVFQFFNIRSNFVYDLVGIWPTIRALRVPRIEINGQLPERPSIRLRELRLPHIDSATVIEWLLPPPPNQQSNLLFLELEAITEEARAVLSVHGHSVSTLALLNQPSFEIADLFPRLEEFVMISSSWRSPLPAFPKTLKHIRLVSGHLSPRATAVAQVVPILTNLRIISIEEKFTASEHYLNLKEVCEAHRVEILVSSLDSSGRPVVSAYQSYNTSATSVTDCYCKHPYHAEMDRFPRKYTFSEFFDCEDRSL